MEKKNLMRCERWLTAPLGVSMPTDSMVICFAPFPKIIPFKRIEDKEESASNMMTIELRFLPSQFGIDLFTVAIYI